jgi:2-polyprenyl-3-methyl-5-hydroxy-6-metoxy-1,4-benzoquinol methylase
MPKGWQWDATLFKGSARYYERGRLPYPSGLAGALASALRLDGRGRLIDVGCGPGSIALRLAHLFEAVAGLDADPDTLVEAERRAQELGIVNATPAVTYGVAIATEQLRRWSALPPALA